LRKHPKTNNRKVREGRQEEVSYWFFFAIFAVKFFRIWTAEGASRANFLV